MEAGLAERVQQAGYRLTEARLAVLVALEEMPSGQHLSAGRVLAMGRCRHPKLSRATVYRTLELLTSLGLLRPIYLGGSDRYYIRSDEGHHHIVCSGCGRVVGFDECAVGDLERRLAKRLGFLIQGHLLEFYGLCGPCQQAGAAVVAKHEPGEEGCYAHR